MEYRMCGNVIVLDMPEGIDISLSFSIFEGKKN